MSDQRTRSTKVAKSRDTGVEPSAESEEHRIVLPAVIEHAPLRPQRRSRSRLALLLVLLMIGAGAGIGGFWWQHHQSRLPPGIAWGNGRLEADEIDIDTKFAGRIAQLFVDEGDMAKAGQVVAMMDTRDLTASLKKSEALVNQAQRALDAATHDVELYRVNILDNTLVAPRDGPIEYRVANVGEVLPAGGKVFTMLDASYVYIDIYLPTAEAGRVRIGSDARIVLDAYPDHVIPAKVVFIASQAQFTPKTVETKVERDKLMFRIRVRIDPERLKGRETIVRSGLPGVAYVRTDPSVAWPTSLQPSAPPSIPTPVTQ